MASTSPEQHSNFTSLQPGVHGSFLVGVSPWPDAGAARPEFFSFVAAERAPIGDPKVVVEYVNEVTGHYFVTLDDNEVRQLDANAFQGWERSIGAFVGYAEARTSPLATVPVCRFFSATFGSHFYSADANECDAVASQWPDVWTLETREAFHIQVPNPLTGRCPQGSLPLFRLFNGKAVANHRYVNDRDLRDTMVSKGWIAEGAGPDAIAMCTPM